MRNPLIDRLQAVSSQGSISAGARMLGLSYRHVWGELKRWETELGNELVLWEKWPMKNPVSSAKFHPVTAIVLGTVHSQVGALEEHGLVGAMLGVHRHTGAR